jgi:hypothetical protein
VGKTKNAPGEMRISPIDKFPIRLYRDVKSAAAQKGLTFKSFLIQSLQHALANPDVIKEKSVVEPHDDMKTDKRQFDDVLRRRLERPPQKPPEIYPPKKESKPQARKSGKQN